MANTLARSPSAAYAPSGVDDSRGPVGSTVIGTAAACGRSCGLSPI